MLDQRRKCWADVVQLLYKYLLFAGYSIGLPDYYKVVYYNMGVSLEVILYSTTHVGPWHVLAHTCQWRHIWLFQSPPHISKYSLIS